MTDLFKLQEIVIASADPKLMPEDTTVFLFIILSSAVTAFRLCSSRYGAPLSLLSFNMNDTIDALKLQVTQFDKNVIGN